MGYLVQLNVGEIINPQYITERHCICVTLYSGRYFEFPGYLLPSGLVKNPDILDFILTKQTVRSLPHIFGIIFVIFDFEIFIDKKGPFDIGGHL